MAEITNASLIFKDKSGNIGKVNTLSASDITKLQTTRDHVAKVVNQTTGEVIKATTTSLGAVQLATDADVTNAVVGKVVDAKQLSEVKKKLATVYKYAGSVDTYAKLPTTGVLNGDVYNVVAAYGNYPAGTNYAAIISDDGSLSWDALGGALDTSNFATKSGNNTFTGTNTVIDITDKSADGQIANKKYVDSKVGTIDVELIKYSATAVSDASAITANTVTFFPSTDLLN